MTFTNARAAASAFAILVMLSATPAHAQEKSAFASTWQSVKEFFQPNPSPETIEPAAGVEQTTAGTDEMLQVPPPYVGPEMIEPAAGDQNPPKVIYPEGITPGPQSSLDTNNTNGFGSQAGLAFAQDDKQIVTAFGDQLPSIEELTNIMPAAGDAEPAVETVATTTVTDEEEGTASQTSTTTVDDEGTQTETTTTVTSPASLDSEGEEEAPVNNYSANDCDSVLRAASIGGRGTPEPELVTTCKNKLYPPSRAVGEAEVLPAAPPVAETGEGGKPVAEKSLFDKLKDAVTPDSASDEEVPPTKAATPAATAPATTEE